MLCLKFRFIVHIKGLKVKCKLVPENCFILANSAYPDILHSAVLGISHIQKVK